MRMNRHEDLLGQLDERSAATRALAAVQRVTAGMAACEDLDSLLDAALSGMARELGFGHALVLLADVVRSRLFAVASHGYAESGAGAEARFGEGAIGLAAESLQPVRRHGCCPSKPASSCMSRDASCCAPGALEEHIRLPEFPDVRSQLAVPLQAQGRLLGVLYLESAEPIGFDECDEVLLRGIADHLATAILLCTYAAADTGPAESLAREPRQAVAGTPLLVRRYEFNQSLFLGDDYLIKGVAGAILWRLLCSYRDEGRTEFTNRELRLDPSIGLPEIQDNLEARLVLLARRLAERSERIRIERVARGRIRLTVTCPLELRSIAPA